MSLRRCGTDAGDNEGGTEDGAGGSVVELGGGSFAGGGDNDGSAVAEVGSSSVVAGDASWPTSSSWVGHCGGSSAGCGSEGASGVAGRGLGGGGRAVWREAVGQGAWDSPQAAQ